MSTYYTCLLYGLAKTKSTYYTYLLCGLTKSTYYTYRLYGTTMTRYGKEIAMLSSAEIHLRVMPMKCQRNFHRSGSGGNKCKYSSIFFSSNQDRDVFTAFKYIIQFVRSNGYFPASFEWRNSSKKIAFSSLQTAHTHTHIHTHLL